MRSMYSLVSSSEVSLPEAISAWSWATVASLCRLGTPFGSLGRVASFAAAKGSASKAATRKVRTAGTIILFLLGELDVQRREILLRRNRVVKEFLQIFSRAWERNPAPGSASSHSVEQAARSIRGDNDVRTLWAKLYPREPATVPCPQADRWPSCGQQAAGVCCKTGYSSMLTGVGSEPRANGVCDGISSRSRVLPSGIASCRLGRRIHNRPAQRRLVRRRKIGERQLPLVPPLLYLALGRLRLLSIRAGMAGHIDGAGRKCKGGTGFF